MLLSFSFNNFRSVKDDCSLDFRKMNLSQHTDTLINGEVLPAAVIYGPNGGGKSTILMAFDHLCVLVGNPIRQLRGFGGLAMPTYEPFKFDHESRNSPSEFCVIFTLSKSDPTEYKYYIKVRGQEILEESLYFKEKDGRTALSFSRIGNEVRFGTKIKSPFSASSAPKEIAIPLLSFIAGTMLDHPLTKVGEWFIRVAMLNFSSPRNEAQMATLFLSYGQSPDIKEKVDEILKGMNLCSYYEVKEVDVPLSSDKFKTILVHHDVDGEDFPLLWHEESAGTQKAMEVLPYLAVALNFGSVAVIDELDSKLHPKLLEFIISLFTSPKTNPKGAQLLFTSHDMYTLSPDFFRRDEIWFACKDEKQSTILYSLGDIKGDDHRTTRAEASFSKKYLEGKYGADPYFTKLSGWKDDHAE